MFLEKKAVLKLKIKRSIIWNKDMECTFFCLLDVFVFSARPPTNPKLAWFDSFVFFLPKNFTDFLRGVNPPASEVCLLYRDAGIFHRNASLPCGHFHVAYQFQLMPSLSTRLPSQISASWQKPDSVDNSVDDSHLRLPAHHLLQKNVDGLHLQVNILHKQNKGGKQYVPLKNKETNKNPVSHLRFGTHPHITSMIYINS